MFSKSIISFIVLATLVFSFAVVRADGPNDLIDNFNGGGYLDGHVSDSGHTWVRSRGSTTDANIMSGVVLFSQDCGEMYIVEVVNPDGTASVTEFGNLSAIATLRANSTLNSGFNFGHNNTVRFYSPDNRYVWVEFMSQNVQISTSTMLINAQIDVEFLADTQVLKVNGVEVIRTNQTPQSTLVQTELFSCGGTFLDTEMQLDSLIITGTQGYIPPIPPTLELPITPIPGPLRGQDGLGMKIIDQRVSELETTIAEQEATISEMRAQLQEMANFIANFFGWLKGFSSYSES